jgi:peptidoglycan hydrolase-like protein with peptidoglycan-binding domain
MIDARRESAETALRLSPTDHQHVQVALTALGFNTNGSDGVFGGHTRDMITAWQKSRNLPGTGFLTGPESQSLQRDAAPAIAKFDDDQNKADDAKKKADEDKAKADAAAAAAAKARPPAPTPVPAAAGPAASVDGHWRGTYQCSSNRLAGEFAILVNVTLRGGAGTWTRPGAGVGTMGNQSLNILVTGKRVTIERLFYPSVGKNIGTLESATLGARFEGGTITGSGPEAGSGGRTCQVILTRG